MADKNLREQWRELSPPVANSLASIEIPAKHYTHARLCVLACANISPAVLQLAAEGNGLHVSTLVEQIARQRNELAMENAALRDQLASALEKHQETEELMRQTHVADVEAVRRGERDRVLAPARRAVLALAHAATKDKTYADDYEALSAAIAEITEQDHG